MAQQHRLEVRASLLGNRMAAASDALAASYGEGGRPAFTEARTRREALDWWRQHRHDEYGQRVLERMPPWEIARLDADLQAWMTETEVTGE